MIVLASYHLLILVFFFSNRTYFNTLMIRESFRTYADDAAGCKDFQDLLQRVNAFPADSAQSATSAEEPVRKLKIVKKKKN
eukprot:m.131819 g.131819  ORF g.131819 m.131819 type:complete len:81 (+) comp13926_c0_seq4:968-1210(+)